MNLDTDPKLLNALSQAAKMKLTEDQLRQQRIDYIVGCLSDERITVTRAQVMQELKKFTG